MARLRLSNRGGSPDIPGYDRAVLRALVFDFNGVLVNDEPIHLKMMQRALAQEGGKRVQQALVSGGPRYLGFHTNPLPELFNGGVPPVLARL